MKIIQSILILHFFLPFANVSFCQSNNDFSTYDIDSLYQVRDSLIVKIDNLKIQLEEVNRIILIVSNNRLEVETAKVAMDGIEVEINEFATLKSKTGPSDRLATIPSGSKAEVIGYSDNHYKIRYDGIIGYLLYIYLVPNEKLIEYNNLLGVEHFMLLEEKITDSTENSKSRKKRKRILNQSKPIKVTGHYRTSKSGKRYYVRPHTRKH